MAQAITLTATTDTSAYVSCGDGVVIYVFEASTTTPTITESLVVAPRVRKGPYTTTYTVVRVEPSDVAASVPLNRGKEGALRGVSFVRQAHAQRFSASAGRRYSFQQAAPLPCYRAKRAR